jgi:hypothetical protein
MKPTSPLAAGERASFDLLGEKEARACDAGFFACRAGRSPVFWKPGTGDG